MELPKDPAMLLSIVNMQLRDKEPSLSMLAGKFQTLSREEYLDLLISCLEHLSPDLVIHRVTGDGPKNLLIAPLWSSAKRSVLNDLHHMMKVRNTWQGRLYKEDLYD